MIFSAVHFDAIALQNPFLESILPETHKHLHHFMFHETPTKVDISAIETRAIGTEQWHLRENCFDLYTPNGSQNSKLARDIERLLGVTMTARNWNTIEKLRGMCRHETRGGMESA